MAWIVASISVDVVRFVSFDVQGDITTVNQWFYLKEYKLTQSADRAQIARIRLVKVEPRLVPSGPWVVVILLSSIEWKIYFEQLEFVLNRNKPLIPFHFLYVTTNFAYYTNIENVRAIFPNSSLISFQ